MPGSAMSTVSCKSFLSSLFEAFSDRLNNQAIAGSIALAGASLLSKIAWKFFVVISSRIKEALFSVYIIPKNTAQYTYFMAWLKNQPAISTGVMQVNVGTRATSNSGPHPHSRPVYPSGGFGAPLPPCPPDQHSEQAMDFAMVPALGTVLSLCFQGSYIWINTGISNGNTDSDGGGGNYGGPALFGGRQVSGPGRDDNKPESLATITTFRAREELVLDILREGKALVTKNAHVTTTIYVASLRQGTEWQLIAQRPARKLKSIVLPGDCASRISKDCSDFLTAEDWYADRGIPYRRGYLLYGKPGCGKTSLVTALAGELKLPIYMLSLATPGLSDSTLLDLLNQTPAHMILLLEDIDAVFDVALKNDEEKKKEAAAQQDGEEEQGMMGGMGVMGGGFGGGRHQRGGFQQDKRQMAGKVLLSFAGILNAVDGVAAQTGRLLFMTTNHKEKLDSALIRPGRIDYQVQFAEATQDQVRALFFNFYKPLEHMGKGDVLEMESVKSRLERLAALAVSEKNLSVLGEQFAARVPEGRYTMAQVQGVFMRHREDPVSMLAALDDELKRLDEGAAEVGEGEEDWDQMVPSLSRQLSGKDNKASCTGDES